MMVRLRIVGDGERDAATLPPLLRTLLPHKFQDESTPWPVRLHAGQRKVRGYALKGYGRKLYYVLRSARSAGVDGVAACVDADKDRNRERLKQMIEAREADRSELPSLPTALGEARPHNEAWLLDDPAAVRKGLCLPKDTEVPAVSRVAYPKAELERLHNASPRADERPLDVWRDIATHVQIERSNHREDTGFQAFADEINRELAPLFGNAG